MSRLMPGSSPIRRMLMSPEWAGARAGAQNLSALRQGEQQGPSAAQAYQQSVMNQALMRQREQEEQLRIQRLNPFFEYEQALEKGYIPEGTTLEQYNNMKFRRTGPTSAMQNFENWKLLNPGASREEQAAAFEGFARASRNVNLGGGGVGNYNPVTGELTTVVTPDEATTRETALEGSTTRAGEQAKTAEEQVRQGIDDAWSARTAYADTTGLLEQSKVFRDMLQDGTVDTGPVTSFLYNVFGMGTEELGALDNEAIMQALKNLGITNLAPVTEREFAEVMRLWIDISRQEEPNIGSVNQAIRRTERLQERIQSDARAASQRVRTYGSDRDFDMLWESNPFIQELYPRDDGEDDEEIEIPGVN